MKDPSVGAGSIFIFFAVYGLGLGALFSLKASEVPLAILFSQIIDVIFMSVVFYRNVAIGDGFGKFFSPVASRFGFFVVGILIPFFLSVLFFPEFIPVTVISLLIAFTWILFLTHVFKGVNGDIVGSSGEIRRMFALLLIMNPI